MTHRSTRAIAVRLALLAGLVLAATAVPMGPMQTDLDVPPPGDLEKGICETACLNHRNSTYSLCGAQASSCLASATNARNNCIASCGGASACVNNCNASYSQAQAICTATYNSCTSFADAVFDNCINNCGGGGGGPDCLAATDTDTVVLSLDHPTAFGQKLISAPIRFALARAEKRGEESFVLDEWAVVHNGQVSATSNSAFARELANQRAVSSVGSFLVIQEPVHAMNSRLVPKPEVRISSVALPRSERGRGEVVAARLELSPAGEMERVDIVYSSRRVETSRLAKLVGQRVGLEFSSARGHRTAVYVAFRLTDRFELLGTVTAFPKCCCNGFHCV